VAVRHRQPTRFKGILAAIAGGALLAISAGMAFQSLRVTGFHTVQGTVLSSKLHSVVTGRINLHKPVIEYSYVVQGKPYRNNVFSPVDEDGTEEWARSILCDYPVGAGCEVYYDPADPQTSTLSVRPTTRAMWLMIGSAFLGLVHLAGGILVVRAARCPNTPMCGSGETRGVRPCTPHESIGP
jgi:hypothetical protein